LTPEIPALLKMLMLLDGIDHLTIVVPWFYEQTSACECVRREVTHRAPEVLAKMLKCYPPVAEKDFYFFLLRGALGNH